MLEKVHEPRIVSWRRKMSGVTLSSTVPPSPTKQHVPHVRVDRTAWALARAVERLLGTSAAGEFHDRFDR